MNLCTLFIKLQYGMWNGQSEQLNREAVMRW